MKFKPLLTLVILFTIISCQSQTSESIKTIEVKAFAKEIKSSKKPQLLDVRTPTEYTEGHIDNALNIDWQGSHFEHEVQKLDKNKAVYVYCRSGKRSLKASEKLAELGFKKIYNLDGGFLQWTSENQKK
ncbi:rhodanese-like domain-containing protein [Flavobacterium nitratireducens]|uniref:rhodanese-like domain-containing protein n=1 Tax=Flavobacterium nitratireducens TaxID=992289 RepID=UPI002414FF82|nr:rhodanese-like domain-containing protein [Flavobacterium nitratireducens]